MKFSQFKSVIIIFVFLVGNVFNVNAQSLGDVNVDGGIDIIDALLVAQEYVDLNPVNFNAAYADVDGNGQVEIIDALLIAQYYVGIITNFPGEPQVTPGPGDEEPMADFEASNYVPAAYELITFDASGSEDPDGTIVNYEWDFDDGVTAAGITVTHSFAENDDYKVVLTVTDNSGLTDEKKKRIFVGRPQGWTEKTHHKSADPDYDRLFPEDRVNRIDLIISPENFQAMENNLATLDMWSEEDPIYVPCIVQFNGYTWWYVGIRYKGQSSLFSPARSNVHKLPFRLNFDKFEDDYPEIDDQCFYGFKEMTFCSNWNDPSFIREKVCSDILRTGGIVAAYGSFIRVFIDTGNGPVYWGLYTLVEDPSDALLTTQFEDDSGNLYKPEGTGADWTMPFRQEAFVKKTNEDIMDFSDVEAAHSALHASRSNAAAWRAGLEAVFNPGIFLRWLAINTVVVNWDSYGQMAQNYYLYQDLADNGRLAWIPWDHNLSMQNSMMGGRVLSFSLDEVGNTWPLIRFLIDDQVYKTVYHQEMRAAIDGCFDEATIIARMQHFHDLIKPYVVGTDGEISGYTFLTGGENEFNRALDEIINHVRTRQTDVRNYLNSLP
ncbi:MAG: CotH kinase family protein [Spirochaetales bacterium]|nr:CotH kinase family protein [Spirochaetales bacterium]